MPRTTHLAVLVLAAAAAASCKSDPWDDPAIGDPFVPDPRTARRVGRLLEDASPRLVTGHGGAAVRCEDRTLWLLSDVTMGFGAGTVRSPRALVATAPGDWPGSEDARILDAGSSAGDDVAGADTTRRWLSGTPLGSDAVLHYAVTRAGPPGEPSLDYLGTGVARLAGDGLEIARPGGDWRFFDRGDPAFGMAVVQADHGVTTGFDYVFGTRGDAGTHRVYVARVPHGLGAERTAYRFFDGDEGWSDDVADAVPLFRAGPHGLSVSWNAHLQAFLAVYAWPVAGPPGEPDRVRVLARASRRPEGPWSRETPLFEVPGPIAPGRVRPDAGAREHAGLGRYDGRILHVTVDGAGGPPRMWRVELPEVR